MEESCLAAYDLRCEYAENPLGIDVEWPRLSWKMQDPQRGAAQSAYQVRVASTLRGLQAEGNVSDVLWDSGRVESDASTHIVYGGLALDSAKRYWWQVQIWDAGGQPSEWSSVAWWEMGLLEEKDWQAQWIAPPPDQDLSRAQPCPMLRRSFVVDGEVSEARLYVSALGLYECELNGARVGDQVLTPGWTSYDCRLQYQAYDVTAALQEGENAAGVTLADGWLRGHLGFRGSRNLYGDSLGLIWQLRIEYVDGRVEYVVSDENWRAATGPLLAADIYNGETYDAAPGTFRLVGGRV